MADGVGFIGLGVMGEPMCRNLAMKSGRAIRAYDLRVEPLDRLAAHGVMRSQGVADTARGAGVVFLSLPGGEELGAVAGELLDAMQRGQTLVDLTTAPVGLTRELAARFATRGIAYADAPVARTRAAAEAGTLSITVGATPADFQAIEPLLRCLASEVTHCGPVGCGQVVKILNNMVIFETGVALAEALAIGRRAGVEPKLLFEALSKGSADSFALRNHGMKAMLPGEFPLRAFSARYALKDLSYALALAADGGLDAAGARLAGEKLRAAIAAGDGENYWPVILRAIDRPAR
ncbi:MAG: NAD(P)-dependent oxidoreductase [Alphaproteobacteria bacterium]|nr:NAD(P)-dependent oxidoreductase [Alphaproteobacteria bacterium]